MIGRIAIAAALPGFNDLGSSVTPTFLSRNRMILLRKSTTFAASLLGT